MLTYFLAGFVALGLIYLVATRRRRPAPVEAAIPAPETGPPSALIIRLPEDRNQYGAIYLRDRAGRVIEGPFAAIGRAADALAGRAGNPERTRTLPYGDTPLGRYRIKRLEPAPTAPLQLGSYGPHGRIILAPVSGEAALAEAAGRFEIAIQGGRLGPSTYNSLRATDGAIRVHDQAIWLLLAAVRGSPGLACEILPLDADPLLDGWEQDDGFGLAYYGEDWDPAWPDPSLPMASFAPDVGPDLTGNFPSATEQVVAGAIVAGAAGESAGEFLSGAYDP